MRISRGRPAARGLVSWAFVGALLIPLCGASPFGGSPVAAAGVAATAVNAAAATSGAVYYVSTTGSDAWPGSITRPWRTLQHAADAAPGSTIYVRRGTYAPFVVTHSGLTFSAYAGEAASVIGNSRSRNIIRILNVSSVTIANLTVLGNRTQYGSGIAVDGSRGVHLRHLTVRDNTSWGIRTSNSSVVIESSNVYGNHTGIEIAHGGDVVVRNNDIHNNDKWIDSGVGAQGISFYETTGSVLVSANRLWGNHTLPGDPQGPEGKAFEIYAARNVTITGNVAWDNRQVLESGTNSQRTPCTNLTFTRNLSYKSSSETLPTMGLILRCFDHSLVANNTFVGLDRFAFDLSSYLGEYGGSIEGLRVMNNLIVSGRTYSLDNAIPASVVLNYNLAYTTTSATAEYGTYDAWVSGHDQTRSLSQFQGWTGKAARDIWGQNPNLGSKYCPLAGSPAINAGANVGLAYKGSAPDIGYCEVA